MILSSVGFKFHPVVRALIFGTVIVSTVQAMGSPFLALYLAKNTGISFTTIGLILGLGAIGGTLGGFLGGIVSDRIGRKSVTVGSLLVMAVTSLGYTYVHSVIAIVALVLLNDFFGACFQPASKALMADLTPENQRIEVYSRRYVGTNIGYVVGPLLGAALGISGSSTPFELICVVYVLFAATLILMSRRYSFARTTRIGSENQVRSFIAMLHVLRSDKVLLLFLLGGFVTTLVHGQWSTPMSVFVTKSYPDGARIFALLLTTNALVVILFQPVCARLFSRRLSPMASIVVGGILFSTGSEMFSIATNAVALISGMVIFSLGEVFIVPSEYAMVDSITPEHQRGAYYGAVNLINLGNFAGPWLFTVLLVHYGSVAMFTAMSILSITSIGIYHLGAKLHRTTSLSNTKNSGLGDTIRKT